MRVKRFFKILSFVLSFIIIAKLIDFFVVPVMFEHWAQHDRKLYSEKIDTLIIGDSLPMDAVRPSVLDEKTGCCSFNSSTAAEYLSESYYLIEDFAAEENIKTVYLGLDYYRFCPEDTGERNRISDIVLNRLNNLSVKSSYIKDNFVFEDLPGLFFRSYVYKNEILNVPSNIRKKLSYEYRNYLIMEDDSYYYDKGYVFSAQCSLADEETESADLKNLKSEEINDLLKIVDLCKEKNIELNVFHTPVQKSRLNSIKNYDVFLKFMLDMSQEHDFRYYDFNYYKDRDELSDNEDFLNAAHLNGYGSMKFTQWLVEVFSKEPDEASKNFNYPI